MALDPFQPFCSGLRSVICPDAALTRTCLLFLQRADITEAPLDVRKLGREELMLVYFFGVHS
jgi:hypothetical protein